MKPSTQRQLDALQDLTTAELREKYAEVFGEATRTRHRRFLEKRITWGLQARDEGGLSERAKRRAAELARESDLRLLPPRLRPDAKPSRPQLPSAGTVLVRRYKGRSVSVTVLDDSFEHDGQVYRSLSAIANKITGSHWSGRRFFGLTKRKGS